MHFQATEEECMQNLPTASQSRGKPSNGFRFLTHRVMFLMSILLWKRMEINDCRSQQYATPQKLSNSCGQSFVVHVSFPQLPDSTKELP